MTAIEIAQRTLALSNQVGTSQHLRETMLETDVFGLVRMAETLLRVTTPLPKSTLQRVAFQQLADALPLLEETLRDLVERDAAWNRTWYWRALTFLPILSTQERRLASLTRLLRARYEQCLNLFPEHIHDMNQDTLELLDTILVPGIHKEPEPDTTQTHVAPTHPEPLQETLFYSLDNVDTCA